MPEVQRERSIKGGGWRTLESFWNTSATGRFFGPAGCRIRVLYGYGWFSYSRQNQTLDGINFKDLRVGGASIAYARMQARPAADITIRYTIILPGP